MRSNSENRQLYLGLDQVYGDKASLLNHLKALKLRLDEEMRSAKKLKQVISQLQIEADKTIALLDRLNDETHRA